MFKIGDKVKVKDVRWNDNTVDRIGIIKVIEFFSEYIGVDFGEGFNGHDLAGAIKTNTGYWISDSELELVKKTKKGNKDRYV